VGTSLNVYPAAGLVQYVQPGVPIYLIDPGEVAMRLPENTTFIKAKAGDGVPRLLQTLIKQIFND
jgi:NAD-dependent deacetylase